MDIRPAEPRDLVGLNAVYNHYVVNSHATFDVEPVTPGQREAWFAQHGRSGRHRVLVAVDDDDVVGFTATGRFRDRAAYETSVLCGVYVAPTWLGRRVGSQLYDALFDALAGEDVHRAYAGIALPNDGSVALHERFGFRPVGRYTEVGRKFGRYWDVAWYEKPLP